LFPAALQAKRHIAHRPHRQLIRNPSFADRRFPSQPPRDLHFPDIAFAPPTQVRLVPVHLRLFLGNDPARLLLRRLANRRKMPKAWSGEML